MRLPPCARIVLLELGELDAHRGGHGGRACRAAPRSASLDLHGAYLGGRGFTLYHAWGPHGARPLTPHFHDEYLICAQLAGHEECQVAGKLHTFSAGDLVFINPQQVHTGNARGSSDLAYITLYVDRGVVDGLAAELGDERGVRRSPEFTQVRATDRRELAADLRGLLALVRSARSQRTGPEGQVPVVDRELDLAVALSVSWHSPSSPTSGRRCCARPAGSHTARSPACSSTSARSILRTIPRP
ncbi:MAG: AraC family ligand binding domain-containing protein [Nannocystis sp.]|nr:AraC family ligand binding domain-containing protein [Nannocystis sp.]